MEYIVSFSVFSCLFVYKDLYLIEFIVGIAIMLCLVSIYFTFLYISLIKFQTSENIIDTLGFYRKFRENCNFRNYLFFCKIICIYLVLEIVLHGADIGN